jgi:hypothetical protein
MRAAALPMIIAALMLAGCGRGAEDGVGGVTSEEAAQLDNAAGMLDTSPDSLAVPPDETGEGDNTVVANDVQ